jgi:hypothetical protein
MMRPDGSLNREEWLAALLGALALDLAACAGVGTLTGNGRPDLLTWVTHVPGW